MAFSFGSDPEFILASKEGVRSAIGVLPHKDKPALRAGHSFYYDNVLAEIAVKPARTRQDVISNVGESLTYLAELVGKNKFTICASATYPGHMLKSRDAKLAGCRPEHDVYTLQVVPPPEEAVYYEDGYYWFKIPFRSAGGHIHVGNEMILDQFEALNVVRMMDLFVAIPCLFMDTDKTSKERRNLYGMAGSHRLTDYGLEYRCLGNFWLSSPEHVGLVYDLTDFCISFVEKGFHKKFWSVNEDLLDEEPPSVAYNCFGYDAQALRNCINACDKKIAEKFMIFASNYLPAEMNKGIENLVGKKLPDPYAAWRI